MTWMFLFLILMVLMWTGNTRVYLGLAIGYVLNPIIGFAGANPIWSIFIGTIIIVSISQTIRHHMTDWTKQAENQNFMKAFNKELSEARKSQNQQRLQKLMELQPQVMSKQMESQGAMMKPTIFTMVFFIAFITWIYTFVEIAAVNIVAIPWNHEYVLRAGGLFSGGVILIYILFTIPLSQMVVNIWKYISFSRRLKALDAEEVPEVTV
jgi:uncharacterized membrane protein (DUF106 family)